MVYNIMLVSGVQQSDSVTHLYISILFRFFPILQNIEFPVLYSKSLLIICFIYKRANIFTQCIFESIQLTTS